MSEQTHTKDWYVAQVVVLTNENKKLTNELTECRRETYKARCSIPAAFLVGYVLCMLLHTFLK